MASAAWAKIRVRLLCKMAYKPTKITRKASVANRYSSAACPDRSLRTALLEAAGLPLGSALRDCPDFTVSFGFNTFEFNTHHYHCQECQGNSFKT